jgi:hypothetical protein
MKSFTVRINQNTLVSAANSTIRTWGTVGQYYFSAKTTPTNTPSIFNIEGFKNVDIYGVSVVGGVQGNSASVNACAVIEDWFFTIKVLGQVQLISGSVSTTSNGFNINTVTPDINFIALSKNSNSVMLSTPYQSVSSVSFESLKTQGIGAEFLNVVSLDYDLYFTFYYKYEGE